jgi:GNAT superfamily N-acetyltransferase
VASVRGMPDPRIAPVEDNLVDFFESVGQSPIVTTNPDPDVSGYYSDRPFPLLNAITGAHFAEGQVERRAGEVLDAYLDRGLPFLWWTTPSGHAEELAPVLSGAGLVRVDVPGMYVALEAPVDPRTPVGVEVREVEPDELPASVRLVSQGFEIPEAFEADFEEAFELLVANGAIQVTAWLDGQPVAAGTVWRSGSTAGLYNIATLDHLRGRGIGYALTATLMELARERGCDHAILHSSPDGLPVYERLGFVEVCQVPQYLWLPPQAAPAEG